MTTVGNWAFQFAFDLARLHDVQLDIFIFPTAPCEGHESRGRRGEQFEISDQDAIEIERRVRLYYDELLGDYDKVGFRLCLGNEAPELKRCLFDREYDILVLAYERRLCPFGERPIEEFSKLQQCPVVLVGPGSQDEIYLNSPAELWISDLGLDNKEWQHIDEVPMGKPERAQIGLTNEGDTLPVDTMFRKKWFALEKEINERTGFHTCTYNEEGAKVTAYMRWSNQLCPVIRADQRSTLTVCGIPREVYALQAGRKGKTLIDECEAGLTKICVPIFVGDEYVGLIGCCGVLMDEGEVNVDVVTMATGLSREVVANLSKDIPRITRNEAEALVCDLEKWTEKILARITKEHPADKLPGKEE